MKPTVLMLAAMSALALSACSTKPRNFAASVSTPITDQAQFESDYRTCQQLVAHGHRSGFRDAAAQGLATGVGTVGAGTAIAAAGMGGVNVGTGAVSASLYAVPFVGLAAGFGVSRAIRGGREKRQKTAIRTCLGEYGYTVASWTKLKRRDDAAAFAAAHPAEADATALAAAD